MFIRVMPENNLSEFKTGVLGEKIKY